MADTFWQRQTDKPLFSEIEWNRPERRDQAGRLLVIGGGKQGFARVSSSYQAALENGVGYSHILLPSSLHNLRVFHGMNDCIFAPSTKSGALGLDAWPEVAANLNWADWTLLPGDLGSNPETALLINKILATSAPVTLTDTSLELVMADTDKLNNRPNTVLFLSFAILQKFFQRQTEPMALTSTMGLVKLVERMHEFTKTNSLNFVCQYEKTTVVASGGEVSTTVNGTPLDAKLASKISVYALQHPTKTFQALTQAIYK